MPKSLSIGQLLNSSSGGIAQVINRAKTLRKLTIQLRKIVDAPMNEHIFVANVRDNVLVIGTDSAVWHARVRYLAPLILDHMKQVHGLEQLQDIQFRVQPVTHSDNHAGIAPKNSTAENNHQTDIQQVLRRLKEKTTD